MSRVHVPVPFEADGFKSAFDGTNQQLEALYNIAPWLDGELHHVGDIDNQLAGTTISTIQHTLGKPVSGFLVVNKVCTSSTDSDIFLQYFGSVTGDHNNENQVYVTSRANVRWYSIWLW